MRRRCRTRRQRGCQRGTGDLFLSLPEQKSEWEKTLGGRGRESCRILFLKNKHCIVPGFTNTRYHLLWLWTCKTGFVISVLGSIILLFNSSAAGLQEKLFERRHQCLWQAEYFPSFPKTSRPQSPEAMALKTQWGRGFVDATSERPWDGDDPGWSRQVQNQHRVPTRGRGRWKWGAGDGRGQSGVMCAGTPAATGCDNGGGGWRNAGASRGWRDTETGSVLEFPEGTQPCRHHDWIQWDQVWLLASEMLWEPICSFKPLT